MAYNQQLSVLSQVAPATTGTSGQVLVSAGSSASSYWASAIPVSAYSAQFNGSSYLSVPNNAALNISSSDYTLEGWWYFTDLSNQNLISKYSVSGGYAIQWYSTNNLRMVFNTAGTDTVYQFAWTPTINTWYHIAITRSGSSGRAFINGTQIGSTTTFITANGDGTTTFQIGLTHTTSEYTRGYASNVRITKGVAIYTGNFTTPTSPLGTSQAAGTNITAVTPSQVSLLTCNGPGFTDSSPNAFALTNTSGVVASQFAPFSSFSAISRSATQTQTILTSGSGTYYTPSGVAWLRVRMVGGGGGGAGGGGGTNGSAGANTTFGTSFLVAGGGGGGKVLSYGVVSVASASIASGAVGIALQGGGSVQGMYGNYPVGGMGGVSPFGGAGAGGFSDSSIQAAGQAAATNSGSGGGGGNYTSTSMSSGSGGAAGAYVEAYISSPSASYAYTVGTGGGGGTGSTGGAGGGGGSGIIIVEENYAVSSTSSTGLYPALYLVVAGGAGAPTSGAVNLGAGGAGGVISTIFAVSLISGTNYAIVVGAGGSGGTNGNNSSFTNSYVAIGGGAGTTNGGAAGGSGGGGSTGTTSGGAGTSGQGNAGGSGRAASPFSTGGGGGAGAAGDSASASSGGNGGVGIVSTLITTAQATSAAVGEVVSTSVYFAGGGGGATNSGGTAGVGGSGGGGRGNINGTNQPVNGTTNTGGGGGGGAGAAAASSGGSGVVIISVPSQNYSGITTGSPTVVTNGNQTVIIFKSSGSYTA